jgi:hypothetical protein
VSWDVWILRPPEGVEAVSDLRSGDVSSPFNRREIHAAAEGRLGALRLVGSSPSRR